MPDAALNFEDGLNVIAGASETGKSYAFQCIDYALGAGKAPKKIREAAGYQTVALRLVVRATNERYEIQRSLAGGEVLIVGLVEIEKHDHQRLGVDPSPRDQSHGHRHAELIPEQIEQPERANQ